jgi:hypothetical protein
LHQPNDYRNYINASPRLSPGSELIFAGSAFNSSLEQHHFEDVAFEDKNGQTGFESRL